MQPRRGLITASLESVVLTLILCVLLVFHFKLEAFLEACYVMKVKHIPGEGVRQEVIFTKDLNFNYSFENRSDTVWLKGRTPQVFEGGMKYIFGPPPSLTDQFRKSARPLFQKKTPLAKIFYGPLFDKIDRFFNENGYQRFLTFFNRFQCLHNGNKTTAGEKFGDSFLGAESTQKILRPLFYFRSRTP